MLQKLSEKKKEKYKMRCDEMRRVYDQKLRDFYTANPGFYSLKKLQWGSIEGLLYSKSRFLSTSKTSEGARVY